MKSRQGTCYNKRTRPQTMSRRQKLKTLQPDLFDTLPDDLVFSVLTKLALTASCPADLMSLLLTLNGLGVNSVVLSKALSNCLVIKAKNWSESSHRFLKRCSDSDNAEASYTLGMIFFFCLQNRGSGASCIAKAAIRSHAPALYSLAVIKFNEGRVTWKPLPHLVAPVCPLLSDFRCNVPAQEPHPANKFLFEWFKDRKPDPVIRLCSHDGCGLPETRRHEFRRCSVCRDLNDCSRACQALDWKLRHKMVCRPVLEGIELNRNVNEDDANVFIGFNVYRLLVF
nr:hypothetical protein [Tanacetum cinerariifolium]